MLVCIRGNQVRLRIEARDTVVILRQELCDWASPSEDARRARQALAVDLPLSHDVCRLSPPVS